MRASLGSVPTRRPAMTTTSDRCSRKNVSNHNRPFPFLAVAMAAVWITACAGSEDVPPGTGSGGTGAGTAGSTGTAGTTGSAGTTGTAGTTGAAGRGGTGPAGTSGTAGTTGAAGRGGTTGSAGNTGTAGRGGTTG